MQQTYGSSYIGTMESKSSICVESCRREERQSRQQVQQVLICEWPMSK